MARIGITYLDVGKAALQLQGQGKLPTVDRVRDLLGTGSKTTITEHLKRWKAEQADGQGKLPQELAALVTGLWERLQAQAEQRVGDLQSSYDEQIKTLQQTLVKTQQEANSLKQQWHHSEETNIHITQKKHAIEQQLQTKQQSYLQLETRYAASKQHIEDLKADNTRLHQMAHQIQANLEHYQQAIQSQRAEQALEIEKREAGFQIEINDLKKNLLVAQQKITTLQEEDQQKHYSLVQAQETLAALETKTDHANCKWQAANQEIAKLTERSMHLEQSLAIQQKEASHYRLQTHELEKQLALSTEQCQQLTKELQHAEDKVEALRHEKLFLVQEKSELAGSLKQLQQETRV